MSKDLAHSLRARLIGEVAGENQACSSTGLESGIGESEQEWAVSVGSVQKRLNQHRGWRFWGEPSRAGGN